MPDIAEQGFPQVTDAAPPQAAVAGYHWYKRLGGQWVYVKATADPVWTDPNVLPGRFYDYYVASYNGAGESPASNIVSVSIPLPGGASPMSERSTTFQGLQIGPENTAAPGTQVAATKRLLCTQIEVNPKPMVTLYRPIGTKGHTAAAKGKEHSENKLSGILAYNDAVYLFESLLKASGGPTPVPGGAVSQKWTYNPSQKAPETPQTFTVESGSIQGASRFGYGVVSALNLKFTEKDCTVDGTMLGQIIQDNVVMTAACPEVARVPVDPATIAIMAGSTPGTMQVLKRLIDAEFQMPDRWKAQKFFDPSQKSFTGLTESGGTFAGKITTEQNTDADSLLLSLRSGSIVYVGVSAQGPLIEAGAPLVNPAAAPTLSTAISGGTIPAGTYLLGYTYVTPSGETQLSPTASQVTTGAASTLLATAPALPLPTGATGINYYAGTAANALTLVGSSTANTLLLASLPAGGAAPPAVNAASTNIYYSFSYTLPVYLESTNRADHNDVWGNDFSFKVADDNAFGLCQATIINKMTTL